MEITVYIHGLQKYSYCDQNKGITTYTQLSHKSFKLEVTKVHGTYNKIMSKGQHRDGASSPLMGIATPPLRDATCL